MDSCHIVALGLLFGITKIVPEEAALSAVLARVPKGTEDLNRKPSWPALRLPRGLLR